MQRPAAFRFALLVWGAFGLAPFHGSGNAGFTAKTRRCEDGPQKTPETTKTNCAFSCPFVFFVAIPVPLRVSVAPWFVSGSSLTAGVS
jgi:hypothetical protein